MKREMSHAGQWEGNTSVRYPSEGIDGSFCAGELLGVTGESDVFIRDLKQNSSDDIAHHGDGGGDHEVFVGRLGKSTPAVSAGNIDRGIAGPVHLIRHNHYLYHVQETREEVITHTSNMIN